LSEESRLFFTTEKLEEVNKRLGCTQKVEMMNTVEGTCLAQKKLIYFFFHFFIFFSRKLYLVCRFSIIVYWFDSASISQMRSMIFGINDGSSSYEAISKTYCGLPETEAISLFDASPTPMVM